MIDLINKTKTHYTDHKNWQQKRNQFYEKYYSKALSITTISRVLMMLSNKLHFLYRPTILHYRNLYAGTRLGFFWILLGPLLMLALYSLTYSVMPIVLPNYSVFQYIINVYRNYTVVDNNEYFSSSCSTLKRDARLRNLGLSLNDIPTKAAMIEFIPFLLSLFLLFILSIISLGSIPVVFICLFFSSFLSVHHFTCEIYFNTRSTF